MTKRDFNKYHKEVYDRFNNRLYPGDTVVLADAYSKLFYIGIVKHFGEKTVLIDVADKRFGTFTQQRMPNRIVKIKDKDGDTDFMQNWLC